MKDLTGNHYFKQTYWGLILMVEYKLRVIDSMCGLSETHIMWRKATPEDLAHLDVYVYTKAGNPMNAKTAQE